MNPIYLDYNATTPLAPEVAAQMEPLLHEALGNPSSAHWAGRQARARLNESRARIAAVLGAGAKNILFTSGGTEALHLAILGVHPDKPKPGRHIITTSVEHSAVLKACEGLVAEGARVTYLPVDADGNLNLAEFEAAFCPETDFVSLMVANNETGVIFPVKELCQIAKSKGALLHLDAVQAAGKMPLNWKELGADFISLSGHKIYGPAGIGCLVWTKEVPMKPLLAGGGQEGGFRAGTENLIGAVGMAAAFELVTQNLSGETKRLESLREHLEEGVLKISGVSVNARKSQRLPNTSSLSFQGLKGHSVLMALDLKGIAVSAGSACASGTVKPSHVLKAMGRSEEEASSAIRVSLGRGTTREEIDCFVESLSKICSH